MMHDAAVRAANLVEERPEKIAQDKIIQARPKRGGPRPGPLMVKLSDIG